MIWMSIEIQGARVNYKTQREHQYEKIEEERRHMNPMDAVSDLQKFYRRK